MAAILKCCTNIRHIMAEIAFIESENLQHNISFMFVADQVVQIFEFIELCSALWRPSWIFHFNQDIYYLCFQFFLFITVCIYRFRKYQYDDYICFLGLLHNLYRCMGFCWEMLQIVLNYYIWVAVQRSVFITQRLCIHQKKGTSITFHMVCNMTGNKIKNSVRLLTWPQSA